MASAFQDVTLTWKGVPYLVPADRMMEAICRIEEHISLEDLNFQKEGGRVHVKRGAISKAFASVLNMAGANVTDAEIYEGMFDKQASTAIIAAVSVLQMMMVPQSLVAESIKDAASKKESGQVTEAAPRSSQRPSRSRAGR